MDAQQLKNVIEAALLAAGGPLSIDQLRALFADAEAPERGQIRESLKALQEDYDSRGIELREVSSGFRVQVREGMAQWLSKLWEERPPRYSRALMETLAIVAYRQPVTRGDVEEIRGVSVTSNIIRTLLERDWIKVVGHRDVPGKPAMFGTTRGFLDYFGLKKLDDLPPLAELAAMEPVEVQLPLGTADQPAPEEGGEDATADAGDADDAADDAEVIDSVEDADDAVAADESDFDDALPEVAVADAAEVVAENPEDVEDAAEVAPGAVVPLVGLNAPGEEHPEPATVASLDEARAAAADSQADEDADASDDDVEQRAEVVPLNNA